MAKIHSLDLREIGIKWRVVHLHCISRDPGIRGTVVYRYIVYYMCKVTCMYIYVICVYVRDGIDMLIYVRYVIVCIYL